MHLPTHQLFTEQLLEARASLVAQMVKNLCTMQETWVLSLGWEDHLEKRMATHSSILAWRTPWTEEPGGLQSMGLQRVRRDWAHTHRFPLFAASFSLVLCTVNFCCLVPWIQFHHSSVSDGFCLGLSFLCSSHKLGVIVWLIFLF